MDARSDPASTTALTVRALVTGTLLASVLSLCNVYAGLRIGWGFNMSITAALLGYAFWQSLAAVGIGRPLGLHENMVNQTGASAGANVSSSGLVAPIPTLTYLTGRALDWSSLTIFVLTVSWVGVVVGIGIRRSMIEQEKLPFPSGIAIAETVSEMYARGAEAVTRVRMLLTGAGTAALGKIAVDLFSIKPLPLPGAIPFGAGQWATMKNLTLALDPSFFLIAAGMIVGPRVGVSLLIGAVGGFGVLATGALGAGWIEPGPPDGVWFGTINKWLLWPGVSMMVVASLTSFSFSLPSLARSVFRSADGPTTDGDVPRSVYWGLLAGVLVLTTALQVLLFAIAWWVGVLAVLLTFVLAVVAGRVSGETGITPVGPMGKVTQLAFGAIAPGDVTANLMAANVTGGAASQVGDLLQDLKAGSLLGSKPSHQMWAQATGLIGGSALGCAAYLTLLPDPKQQLFTEQWPAPAAAQWKAVAELLTQGVGGLPDGALTAAAIAGLVAMLLATVERFAPASVRGYVPSASSIGLALVIPAYYGIAAFIGSMILVFVRRFAPAWNQRYTVVLAAGLIAGESLTGIALAFRKILAG
jgi:uncharacterized oligopeptide transporter (OPT) family protein